ncbi:hypothetical protein FBU31_001891 [Coemansia sp. 'formosensis']|nr:hypothetical protein FBU31_001891 [Coemansia sp. 'formosensis']
MDTAGLGALTHELVIHIKQMVDAKINEKWRELNELTYTSACLGRMADDITNGPAIPAVGNVPALPILIDSTITLAATAIAMAVPVFAAHANVVPAAAIPAVAVPSIVAPPNAVTGIAVVAPVDTAPATTVISGPTDAVPAAVAAPLIACATAAEKGKARAWRDEVPESSLAPKHQRISAWRDTAIALSPVGLNGELISYKESAELNHQASATHVGSTSMASGFISKVFETFFFINLIVLPDMFPQIIGCQLMPIGVGLEDFSLTLASMEGFKLWKPQ